MAEQNYTFDDIFGENVFIEGFFGDEYSQLVEEIIQLVQQISKSSSIWFPDDDVDYTNHYLPSKLVYLSKAISQYLRSESFKLSDTKLTKLQSAITKLTEDGKLKFRTESNYI